MKTYTDEQIAKIREHLNATFLADNDEGIVQALAILDQGQEVDERAEFEKWMINTAQIIVGSADPYPAGHERDYWEVWQARAALPNCQK